MNEFQVGDIIHTSIGCPGRIEKVDVSRDVYTVFWIEINQESTFSNKALMCFVPYTVYCNDFLERIRDRMT